MVRIIPILAVIGILLDSVSAPLQVLAEESMGSDIVNSITEDDWYSPDGELQFPITRDDERWPFLYNEENKNAACQIPDSILSELSTEDLLYMVEQYPNYTILYWFEDQKEGFQALRDQFNGLDVLLQRTDCKDVVLEAYTTLQINEKTKYDYNENTHKDTEVEDINRIIKDDEAMILVRQDAREKYIVAILEMILAQPELQVNFTEEDSEILGQAIMEKSVMKSKAGCFEYNAPNYFANIAGYNNGTMAYVYKETMKETCVSIANVLSPDVTGSASILVVGVPAGTVITTASGNVVQYENAKPVKSTLTDADIETELSGRIMCSLVERLRLGYNCYAYAYLSLDKKNMCYRKNVIVNDLTPFGNDKKYKSYTTARLGAVAKYEGHAGVVVNANYQGYIDGHYINEPIIESVWLQYHILVSHPVSQYGASSACVNFIK